MPEPVVDASYPWFTDLEDAVPRGPCRCIGDLTPTPTTPAGFVPSHRHHVTI
jgi:hypothetical protein